eukprot:TRINITY_DN32154_c0_g1_i1.p1 TRINITY_DN32154_c0_g1~~TRINITY_DN32154_c0_g1_i1.p1  ORF type:complete len:454 (-),score=113.54 TRINITY_DN32154_c0_g1_i1:82-1443(-)
MAADSAFSATYLGSLTLLSQAPAAALLQSQQKALVGGSAPWQPPPAPFQGHTAPKPRAATWSLPRRYEAQERIGVGSYGTVWEALDHDEGRMVAIKRIHSVFSNKVNCKRILRELAILQRLDHRNIVRLYDVFAPEGEANFDELYMVMELGDADLKSLVRKDVTLEALQVKFILYHLLVGLKYLHSAGIYHRDLKPSNVLVNQDCDVKICDFGLARAVGEEELEDSLEGDQPQSSTAVDKANRVMTQHVATRFYRAPELILLEEHYTEAIDVWSAGCIAVELAEMMEARPVKERGPLFPGSTCFPLSPDSRHQHDSAFHSKGCGEQLNVIFDVMGTPSEAEVARLSREDARQYIRCFRERLGTGIRARLPSAEEEMVAAIEPMLRFSHQDRATVEEVLTGALFQGLRDPEKEVVAPGYITLEFDQEPELSEQQLRRCFSEEIRGFHRALAARA